jgi:TRAP-type transport system periplasmic protein
MQRQVKRWVRIVTRFATAVAGLTVALVPQARAETLKLLSSWAENDRPSYVNALIFQKHVKDVSEGKLTITINGPEVVPPFEQLQPVSAGIFDILYTHGAYHVGSRGLALAADSIEFNIDKRREVGDLALH